MAITINGNGTLTGISSGGLPDGCVVDADINGMAASKLTGALPAISGASLTNLPASGITMTDNWRLTTSFTGDAVPIASNWERDDTSPYEGTLGTGLTESSGVFTFPTTGWYFVIYSHHFYGTGSSPWNDLNLQLTNDNGSNWTSLGHTSGWANHTSTTYQKQVDHNIVDITNVSNQKMRFVVYVDNDNYTTYGSTSMSNTGFDIFRIGDT